jgi:hypothetical protein
VEEKLVTVGIDVVLRGKGHTRMLVFHTDYHLIQYWHVSDLLLVIISGYLYSLCKSKVKYGTLPVAPSSAINPKKLPKMLLLRQ